MVAESINHIYQPAFWQPLEKNFVWTTFCCKISFGTLNPPEQQTARPQHQPNHFHRPGCSWMNMVITLTVMSMTDNRWHWQLMMVPNWFFMRLESQTGSTEDHQCNIHFGQYMIMTGPHNYESIQWLHWNGNSPAIIHMELVVRVEN